MAYCLAFLLFFAGGDEFVRLQLRDGATVKGTVTRIDEKGRYVLRRADGETERISYDNVLNVTVLTGERDGAEAGEGALSWPGFARKPDLIAFIVKQLNLLPDGGSEAAIHSFIRGVELIRNDDLPAAIHELSQVLEKQPAWLTALFLRAAAFAESGELHAAAGDAAAALRLGPDSVPAYELAAEISFRRGLRHQGNLLYAEALSRSYSGAERNWRLGHFWLEKDPEKARGFFAAYQKQDPDLEMNFCVEGRFVRLAWGLELAGNYDRAVSLYQELMAKSPFLGRSYRTQFGKTLHCRAQSSADAGNTGAAIFDLKEAALYLPGQKRLLELEAGRLTIEGISLLLTDVSSLEMLLHLQRQLGDVSGQIPPSVTNLLTDAYKSLCRRYFEENRIDRVIEVLNTVRASGIEWKEVGSAFNRYVAQHAKISAANALQLAETFSRFDRGFLQAGGRFLLEPQLAELRKDLVKGKIEGIGEKVRRLESLFGRLKEIEELKTTWRALEKDGYVRLNGSADDDTSDCHDALLSFFPMEKGLWWEYVSSTGKRERWRIDEVVNEQHCLKACFTGEITGPKGTFPCEKNVYFTGSQVLAHAPKIDDGGRLLLWAPLKTGASVTTSKQPVHRRIKSYVSLDETLACNGKKFTGCAQVKVRNLLVDQVSGECRMKVESHYWYAPDVGLVRIESQGDETWTLASWGRDIQMAEKNLRK